MYDYNCIYYKHNMNIFLNTNDDIFKSQYAKGRYNFDYLIEKFNKIDLFKNLDIQNNDMKFVIEDLNLATPIWKQTLKLSKYNLCVVEDFFGVILHTKHKCIELSCDFADKYKYNDIVIKNIPKILENIFLI